MLDILYNTGKKMSNNFHDKNTTFAITTLDKIQVGQSCRIVRCDLHTELKIRLAEMGLVPHTKVTVLKTAPLGDPIEVTVRGYSLCIRAETAKHFTVTTEQQNALRT